MGYSSPRVAPSWVLLMGQSCRNRLLQGASPMDPNSSKRRCLSVGFSPWSVVFSQEPHAEWAHHGVQFPSGHIHGLQHGSLPRMQCRYLLWHGPPGAEGRQPASPWSPPQATEESLLQCLKHVLLFLPPGSWCQWGCFISFSFVPFTAAAVCFLPFLRFLFTEVPLTLLIGSALASSGYSGHNSLRFSFPGRQIGLVKHHIMQCNISVNKVKEKRKSRLICYFPLLR